MCIHHALIDEKLYSEEVAVLVYKCISERRNNKCVIRRNMKVHLRNIKMKICEKEKYEVGNICNKEEYAPSPYFDLFLMYTGDEHRKVLLKWNMSESVILPQNIIKIRLCCLFFSCPGQLNR